MRLRGTARTGEHSTQIVCLALLHDWLPYNVFVVSLTLPPTRPFHKGRPGVALEALYVKIQEIYGKTQRTKSTARAQL